MVTQLLYGELCRLIDKRSMNWLKIECVDDNYIGWLDIKQIYPLTAKEFEHYYASSARSLEISQPAIADGKSQMLTLGARLPLFDGMSFQSPEGKYLYSGQVIYPDQNGHSEDLIIKLARKYLYSPYLWGGRSPFGIDCSGFTQLVFKMLGYKLPRDAHLQASEGALVDFVEQCKVGDLAFFATKEGNIHHVGIVINDQRIIHASGRVRIDKLDHQGIYNKERRKYTHNLRLIKRIFI
jgi:hypothetical protein